MSSPETNHAAWMAKGDHDILNIENNLAAVSVPWDTVCFHAQQAAEKFLKAFLVSRGQLPPRTHDLVALLADCAEHDPSLASLETDSRTLTSYAVGSRYPGDLFEPSEAEGRRMAAIARRIRDEILRRLPQAGV
jgi:HEPN domain-containing protein